MSNERGKAIIERAERMLARGEGPPLPGKVKYGSSSMGGAIQSPVSISRGDLEWLVGQARELEQLLDRMEKTVQEISESNAQMTDGGLV